MGRPKALVELGGRLLVESAAEVLRAGGCAPVVVVLGAAAEEVRARAALPGCALVDNPDWPTGMGSSLRHGLDHLTNTSAEFAGLTAVIVLPVDVPEVTAAAVRRVAALAAPDVLARADYDDGPGHPVLLGRAHWAGARESARGDAGARDYLRAHRAEVRLVPCADIASGTDVDRPEDLDRLRRP